MASIRAAIGSPRRQGVDERLAYTLTTTPFAASPTSASVLVKDISNAYTDVSASVLSGSPSIAGDVITTPLIQSLTAGHSYRVEVKFETSGSVTYEPYFELEAEM